MIKKFNEYNINENMGYKSFFGKEVSHEDALQDRIRSLIIHIVTEERNISEKSLSKYDEVIDEVKNICNDNPEIYQEAQIFYDKKKRLNLLAEQVYDKYIKKGK